MIENDWKQKPCIMCGEPVKAKSMSGTRICPWCDMGKCRYCGVRIMVFKEQYDDGRSKRDILNHMEWHKNNLALKENGKK